MKAKPAASSETCIHTYRSLSHLTTKVYPSFPRRRESRSAVQRSELLHSPGNFTALVMMEPETGETTIPVIRLFSGHGIRQVLQNATESPQNASNEELVVALRQNTLYVVTAVIMASCDDSDAGRSEKFGFPGGIDTKFALITS